MLLKKIPFPHSLVLSLTLLVQALAMAPPAQAGDCEIAPALQSESTSTAVLARATRQLSATPRARAHLHTEGTLPHQGIREESVEAERDFPLMLDAAIAWRRAGDPRFVQQLDAYFQAWTAVYQPDFNPIDETRFDDFITAYVLSRSGLALQTDQAMRKFLRLFAEGYMARSEARSDPTHGPRSGVWTNNWQSHRIKLMALSASALQDRDLMVKTQAFFVRQLEDNVQPDGSVDDFMQRDALHYVVYDLEPLTAAALAAQGFGMDWLHSKAPSGASLQAAVDWLLPYAKGEREHVEFAHTRVDFDKKRAAAGVSGFNGTWDPAGAAALYWQVAALDARYLPLAQKLSTKPPLGLLAGCGKGPQ